MTSCAEDFPIATAPRDGTLIEVRFVGGGWDRVRWSRNMWLREESGSFRVDGGGCMPGEWERIGRWRPFNDGEPLETKP